MKTEGKMKTLEELKNDYMEVYLECVEAFAIYAKTQHPADLEELKRLEALHGKLRAKYNKANK